MAPERLGRPKVGIIRRGGAITFDNDDGITPVAPQTQVGQSKNGPGTLVFGGPNTYTGNTVVNQGALLVTNTTGSGTGTTQVTVNATGTFAGAGNGTTVIAPGGQKFIVRYNDGGAVTLEATDAAASPYDTWAAGFGLNPATNGAPGADPDQDGIPNGIEFVIGGNPTLNSSGSLPEGEVVGTNFVFTFTRSEASKAYEVRVETSSDLVTWPPAASFLIPTSTTAGPPVTVVDASPATPDQITVSVPMGTDPTKFGRLRVTIP